MEEEYLPRLRGIEPTEMFTIVWRDEEVGFIQRYLLRDHPDWERSLQPTGETFGEAAAAGEIMAGNVLGKGYAAGIGMTIGSVFGRVAGREAARNAKN